MNKKNILNKVLFGFVGIMLFATSAFAIPKGPCDKPQDVCCEEAVGPYAFSYPKDVGLSCPRDFYAHGEFLWMKPIEDGLEYTMQQNASTSYTFPLELGQVQGFSADSNEWDWRPGFRIGFGFYANHDAWNFDINWTYIKIKADSDIHIHGVGTLLGLFLPPNGAISSQNWQPAGITMDHASARWSGDYSTFDVMMGKPYHVSRYYVSNPMFGIRAGWIDQDYHIRYFISDIKRNTTMKNDFWGVGLRGYYEGQFLLGSGAYIYGKVAMALLYGKFDTSQHGDNYPVAVEYKTEDSFYAVKPNAEVGFGLAWSKYFCKHQYQVSLKVGYEFHQWWDQNQARKFFAGDPVANDIVSRGDLSFNGFLFGLHFEF